MKYKNIFYEVINNFSFRNVYKQKKPTNTYVKVGLVVAARLELALIGSKPIFLPKLEDATIFNFHLKRKLQTKSCEFRASNPTTFPLQGNA